MVAADTSTFLAYLKIQSGGERLIAPIRANELLLPPVAIAELLSDPALTTREWEQIAATPMVNLLEGYWARAGRLRALVLSKGHKAAFADALIAQSCIDIDIPLITLDRDFRHFVRYGGLRLAD